jgi:hypothetical protein
MLVGGVVVEDDVDHLAGRHLGLDPGVAEKLGDDARKLKGEIAAYRTASPSYAVLSPPRPSAAARP